MIKYTKDKEFRYETVEIDYLNYATVNEITTLKNKIQNLLNAPLQIDKDYILKETYYSNLIEGVEVGSYVTTKAYLTDLKLTPSLELEILLAFKNQFENLPNTALSCELIKTIHKNLYSQFNYGGKWKTQDNYLINTYTNEIIYMPPPYYLTDYYMTKSVENFNLAMQNADKVTQFMIICKFIFDFGAVHPFLDGNGRVSRILFYYLLKYYNLLDLKISLSEEIYNQLNGYYNALQIGNHLWEVDKNNYYAITNYFVEILSLSAK